MRIKRGTAMASFLCLPVCMLVLGNPARCRKKRKAPKKNRAETVLDAVTCRIRAIGEGGL